ncbi:MAG: Tetratricopeptide 4 [Acidimicrobiales bacterium]|nr:Tetratricopeptide 4 [Acidimicrobiales bacterium]
MEPGNEEHRHGGSVRRRVVGAVLVVLVLAPFALGLGATHSSPAPALAQASSVPAAPLTPRGSRELAAGLAALPMVVRGLPDAASAEFVRVQPNLSLLDPGQGEAALDLALRAVTSRAADVAGLRAQLLQPIPFSVNPGPTPVMSTLLRSHANDPADAGRLVNVAVALFDLGAFELVAPTTTASPGNVAVDAARTLLEAIHRAFPRQREGLIDLAFVRSVTDPRGSSRSVDLAVQALGLDPTDLTARALLASLQARNPADNVGSEAALRTLQPLLVRPSTQALGWALVGDALLGDALVHRQVAVGSVPVLARRALDAYDRALGLAPDPGLWAGRARALVLLGHPRDAWSAVEEGVRRAPGSVDLRLNAAAIAEEDGRLGAMAAEARRAFDRSTVGWSPRLSAVRFVGTVNPGVFDISDAPAGDPGWLGTSIGSELDHVGIFPKAEGLGGGALALDIDLLPARNDPLLDDWRTGGFAPDAAAALLLEASIGRLDLPSAAADEARWEHRIGNDRLFGRRAGMQLVRHTYWAAQLVVDQQLPPGAGLASDVQKELARAESTLRRVRRFDLARRTCGALATSTDPRIDRLDASRCEGEAALLAGDARAAVPLLAAAGAGSAGFTGHERLALIAARLAAGRPGELAVARNDLDMLAVAGTTDSQANVTALVVLGDLDLRDDQLSAAAAHYRLALVALGTYGLASLPQSQAVVAHAQANLSVVGLRQAQPDPTAPPTCRGAQLAVCRAARADARAALMADPSSPVAAINLGWADRSLGDVRAAAVDLRRAVTADTTLYPAWNDLGVLAARAHDRSAARSAFAAALAASPHYAAARWNLGVLALREGLGGLRAAQGELASAVRNDASFAGDKLDYKTDERVYRVTFNGIQPAPTGWPVGRGYAIGAAALGAVSLIGAAGAFGDAFVGGLWSAVVTLPVNIVSSVPGAPAVRRRARSLHSRLGARARRWLPWVVTGLTLMVVSTWTVATTDGAALPAVLALLTLALASALATHEVGHLLAMRRTGARLAPRHWTAGSVAAVAMVPLHVGLGPYLAERFEGVDDATMWWVHLTGPVANLGMAALAYAAYLVVAAPVLLLTAQVNLAVTAYTLLPTEPLDGFVLATQRPATRAVLALVVTAAATALAVHLL